MKMTKAIIFDSDGMLTYDPGFSKTFSKQQNIPLDDMLPFFKGPFKECLVGKADLKEELHKGWLERWRWKGSVDELLTYWFAVSSKPDQEILASILELRERGIICVLATNQEKYRTDYMLGAFGYAEVFDKVFSSAYVGHKKPSPEFFDEVLKYLHSRDSSITKADVMFWDDDPENVEGAQQYGFDVRQFINTQSYKNVISRL